MAGCRTNGQEMNFESNAFCSKTKGNRVPTEGAHRTGPCPAQPFWSPPLPLPAQTGSTTQCRLDACESDHWIMGHRNSPALPRRAACSAGPLARTARMVQPILAGSILGVPTPLGPWCLPSGGTSIPRTGDGWTALLKRQTLFGEFWGQKCNAEAELGTSLHSPTNVGSSARCAQGTSSPQETGNSRTVGANPAWGGENGCRSICFAHPLIGAGPSRVQGDTTKGVSNRVHSGERGGGGGGSTGWDGLQKANKGKGSQGRGTRQGQF